MTTAEEMRISLPILLQASNVNEAKRSLRGIYRGGFVFEAVSPSSPHGGHIPLTNRHAQPMFPGRECRFNTVMRSLLERRLQLALGIVLSAATAALVLWQYMH